MSENDAPQPTQHVAEPAGAVHEAQHPAPAGAQPAKKPLSMFLIVSIALLIGLTVAAISLLFIGDFEGRFERVFSTFALFAVFVLFTAVDTNRERQNNWYAPVALIANTYILALLLVVIWMTPFHFSAQLMTTIIWKSLLVIIITRLVMVCCELLLRLGERAGGGAQVFAFLTSALAVLSGILFTAPVGIEAFSLRVPQIYWQIATSALILTALGLSVTLLLRWAGTADERAARAQAAHEARITHPAPRALGASRQSFPAPQQVQAPQYPQPHVAQPHVAQPHAAQPHQQQVSAPAPAPAQAQRPLLPWPTFADGRPIPAGPDGQPDFTVPGAPRPPQF